MNHRAPHIEGLTDERVFLPGEIHLNPEQMDIETRMANRSWMMHQGRAVAAPTTRERTSITFRVRNLPSLYLRQLLGVIEACRRLPRNRDTPTIILQTPTHQLRLNRYHPREHTIDQTSEGDVTIKITLDVDNYDLVRDKG